MEFVCDQCNTKLSIADDKLPEGKIATIRCPKCKNKISVDLRQGSSEPPAAASKPAAGKFDFDEGSDDDDSEDYSAERPFDFLEEEGNTALICENDPEIVKQINIVLGIMEYSATVAVSVRDALRKMKFHTYNMILVNETFDGSDPDANGLLLYLERLSMDVRRNIFVGLLTRRHSSMDNMTAFLKSVNVTINLKDMSNLDKLLVRGINEHEMFYAMYKESMKKLGMA